MVNAMDYAIVARELRIGKGVTPFILPAMRQIVQQLFFKKDGFSIK